MTEPHPHGEGVEIMKWRYVNGYTGECETKDCHNRAQYSVREHGSESMHCASCMVKWQREETQNAADQLQEFLRVAAKCDSTRLVKE